jgi:hypothetical protein
MPVLRVKQNNFKRYPEKPVRGRKNPSVQKLQTALEPSGFFSICDARLSLIGGFYDTRSKITPLGGSDGSAAGDGA